MSMSSLLVDYNKGYTPEDKIVSNGMADFRLCAAIIFALICFRRDISTVTDMGMVRKTEHFEIVRIFLE